MQPTLAAHAIAALLGTRVARADERYRPMSRTLLLLLAVHAGRYLAQALRPGTAERVARYAAGLPVPPYEDVARASWAVDQVLVLAWYAALTWVIWRELKEKSPNHPDLNRSPTHGVGFGVTPARTTASHCRDVGWTKGILLAPALLASSALLLFAAYPLVRGRPMELATTVVFCAALAVQLAAATLYILRWRRPDVTRGVALVLVVGSLADAAGPYIMAHPARDWYAGEPVGVLVWLVILGAELWGIVSRRES